jgi:hypothetical protein
VSIIIEVLPTKSLDGHSHNHRPLNYIGWNICKVYEHVNVLRCFKCGGFNHTSEKCKEDVSKCLNCCEEGHDEKDCNNNSVCVNCLKLNKSNNLNLKVDHSRFNYSCEVYKKQVSISKSKTRYSM